jgi:hypothetical protein
MAAICSKQTIANFIEKASRLYEQQRRADSASSPFEMYVRRWLGWAKGVLRRGSPYLLIENHKAASRRFADIPILLVRRR